ncbi:MAG: futalosine hydrolase [Acidobacteria bacterium]|nr:futalosine hydrolase [Acidobacteriota bacterium]
MRILLVSATAQETAAIAAKRQHISGHDIDLLVTGVGMVATAARCAQAMTKERYDLALNLGVCGSFDRTLPPGTVVHVVSDRLAELGAEDDEAFLTLQQMHLLGDDEFPFTGGRLVNAHPPVNATLERLPAVDGITVNTVHGNARSIATVTKRFAPQVESMEGAAFMYCCLIHGLAFAQVRAVSNVVEARNRAAWKMAEAIDGLTRATLSVLEHA